MDLLRDLRTKVSTLGGTPVGARLEAVLRHVEIAARHLRRGVDEGDDDFFNDAVYRANQAYEGALKEAWEVVHGKPAKNKKTHQFESDLVRSGSLTERATGASRAV